MNKFIKILLALLAALFISHECQAKKDASEIRMVKDMNAFSEFQGLNRSVVYWLGQREEGDYLTRTYIMNHRNKRSIEEKKVIPIERITYVEVCYEGNGVDQVRIVNGGIGERFISLVLEQPTQGQFNYAYIFGI